MKRMLLFVLVVTVSVIGFSCGKKKSKGEGLGLNVAPVEPPVSQAMPSGLKPAATALSLLGMCADRPDAACSKSDMIAILVDRVFAGRVGCMNGVAADIQGRVRCELASIDVTVSDYDRHAKEVSGSKRKCLDEPLKDYPMTIPTIGVFNQQLNCASKLESPAGFVGDQYLAFGTSGDTFYMRQTQTGPSGYTILIKVDKPTSETEAVMVSTAPITATGSSDGSAQMGTADQVGKKAITIQHFIARPGTKVFQYVIGSNHNHGNGVGCGVSVRSDANHVFGKGIFASPAIESLETNCAPVASETSATRYMETCLSADLAAADSAACSAINTFDLSPIRPADIPQAFYDTVRDISFYGQVSDINDFVDQ